MAFTLIHHTAAKHPDEKASHAQAFVSKHPNTIFASTGLGDGTDAILVSVHRNYSDCAEFTKKLKNEFTPQTSTSFLVSLKSDNIFKHLTLKNLANYLKEKTE